ncbi:MAG: SLATT domain-containing protein [Bryobacteraceae bacterium]|nr:SLATT domain-containing protein [Bryobacteraceae bacterium]
MPADLEGQNDKKNGKDLRSPSLADLRWDTPAERVSSIAKLYGYADGLATDAANWYWKNKNQKKLLSQAIRYVAIGLTGVAGLLPIIRTVWEIDVDVRNPELLVSLLIGVATALLGWDRFGGFSTGWMRYVKHAMAIQRIQHEFRLEWTARLAQQPPVTVPAVAGATAGGPTVVVQQASPDIDPATVAALIERAKQMILSVQDQVAKETGEWAAEFEKNLSQLESDVRSQWAEYRKKADEQAAAERPGSIVLTVKNALALDQASFTVALYSPSGVLLEQTTLKGTQTWVRTSATPGTHALIVSGLLKGVPREVRDLAEVKAATRTDLSVELPV